MKLICLGKVGNLSLLNSHKLVVMTIQHPFSFFFSLVETDRLNALKGEFYAGADQDNYEQTVDREKESRRASYSDGGFGWQETEYFTDYLFTQMQEQRSLAMQQLDLLLMHEPDVKRMYVCLTSVKSSLDLLIKKVKVKKELKRYPAILECLNSLLEYVEMKEEAIRPPVTSAPITSDGKLQWLGQENVLGTLFYDLFKGQDGGAPYIKAKSIDIQRFIVANFRDKHGGTFSHESLKTIFTPGKGKKRAPIGTRIELPNKKSSK